MCIEARFEGDSVTPPLLVHIHTGNSLGMNVKQICQLILVPLKTKYNKCFLLLQLVDEEKVAGIGNAAGCYFLFVKCVIDVG